MKSRRVTMSARTLPSGQEEVDQYGDSSTALRRACGDHLAGMRAMRTRPQGAGARQRKAGSAGARAPHGRRGPRGRSSASDRRPETHHGPAEARCEGAQQRCAIGVHTGVTPARCRRRPDTRASHASRAEPGRELGGGPGTGAPVETGAVELRVCDRWFRSVVLRSLRWSLLLWLRLSPTGSPVVAGLRPSRRLRVVHLCVGFTWNMSASALSPAPASRSACLPASLRLRLPRSLRVRLYCCARACPRGCRVVCVRSRVDHAGECAVRLRRSGRCAHGCGPPE